MVDFNIVVGGETASPLNRLLQEIQIVMTSSTLDLITAPMVNANLEQYLFKQGVDPDYAANQIKQYIVNNVTNDGQYDIDVTAKFMNGQGINDVLYVDTCIYLENALQEQLIYTITANGTN